MDEKKIVVVVNIFCFQRKILLIFVEVKYLVSLKGVYGCKQVPSSLFYMRWLNFHHPRAYSFSKFIWITFAPPGHMHVGIVREKKKAKCPVQQKQMIIPDWDRGQSVWVELDQLGLMWFKLSISSFWGEHVYGSIRLWGFWNCSELVLLLVLRLVRILVLDFSRLELPIQLHRNKRCLQPHQPHQLELHPWTGAFVPNIISR